ncbi:MAG: hypothetical protein QG635_2086 [Bacteroidota bacterium]|nr:hypothetical protein [Bacteroidota bacterium]
MALEIGCFIASANRAYKDRKMNLNYKQEQIIKELIQKIEAIYPEITFQDIQSSPGDRDLLWINVTEHPCWI